MYKRTTHKIATALLLLTSVVIAKAQAADVNAYAKVPNDAYAVTAEIQAKPGQIEALRAATMPLIPLVRHDPKNLVYYFSEDRDKVGHFVFFEVYATKADFDAHNDSPYVKAWFAKLPRLADGGIRVTHLAIANSR